MNPELTNDVTLPGYGRSSLCDLLPSIASALGVGGEANTLGLPSWDRFVLLLVDGLGWNLLNRHAEHAPYLASLLAEATCLTSGVPSTTATSLVSLGTGDPPGGHGVLGYTTRIPGSDRLLNALSWDAAVDPREWQPRSTVFERAERAGIAVSVVNRRSFRSSGLTVAGMRGGRYIPADTGGERVAAVVAGALPSRSLTYAYESDLDTTGHRHGCGSDAWLHQLSLVDALAGRIRAALPRGATLLVTADHGMVDVSRQARVDVDQEPELLAGVQVFAGEARFRHLYCDPDAAGTVAARWRQRLGESAIVLTADEAIAQGWFGVMSQRVRPRLGDVLVASLGNSAVESSSRFPVEMSLIGLHGSLSADEMCVPLLIDAG